MLLFVNATSDDTIDVLDAMSLEPAQRVLLDKSQHQDTIGPRAGVEFLGYGAVANCFENTISIIDPRSLKEIKTIGVGAYPAAMTVGHDNLYVACGDSNSIWTIGKDMEVSFVDKTVDFPYGIACSNNEICVCGLASGRGVIYNRDNFKEKESFGLADYPYGVAYFKGCPAISCYGKQGGTIFYKDKYTKVGKRIDKVLVFNDELYALVDDCYISIMNEKLEEVKRFNAMEPIGDFAVGEYGVYSSGLLSGKIKMFLNSGELCNEIDTGKGGKGIFLLSQKGV